MDNLIKFSKPPGNRNGLGFKKSLKHKNYSSLYNRFKKSDTAEKMSNTKIIKIWIPKSNNKLIRQKHINNYLKNVVHNKNYSFKGPKPSWVWQPSLSNT